MAASTSPNSIWRGHKIEDHPVFQHNHGPVSILFQLKGTVLKAIWVQLLVFPAATVGLFIFARSSCGQRNGTCPRPFVEKHLPALHAMADLFLLPLGCLLVAYVALAFVRYHRFYWTCRKLQDSIGQLALTIGSAIDSQKTSQEVRNWVATMERYLNLAHFFSHRTISPVLETKAWAEIKQTCVEDKIMGLTLVEEGEWDTLEQAFRLGGDQGPILAVLSWLTTCFDEGSSQGFLRDDILKSRMISLNLSFQDNLEALSKSASQLKYQKDLCIPVPVFHLVHTVVDILSLVVCAALVHGISDSLPASNSATYQAIPSIVGASFSATLFLQGSLALADRLLHPEGQTMTGTEQLLDPEFAVEVRSMMNQTRVTTHTLFRSTDGTGELLS